MPPNKAYLSCLHSSHNYIFQTKYLLKPNSKTTTLLHYLETLCSTIVPPTKLYVFLLINKNNHFVLNTLFSHHVQGYFLSKNIQPQIPIKTTYTKPFTLYPYTTSYKKPSQHTTTQKQIFTHTYNNLTKKQHSNAKTKPTHTPTHPQTNIPSLQDNPYQHTKSKTKPITLTNKHIKRHQTNTKHPTIYLKRARPNGLAPNNHHNIASTQNQRKHSLDKAHTTGHKNINNNTNTKKVLTNTQTNHKSKHKKQTTQIPLQNQIILIQKINTSTHTKILIIYYIEPTPPPKNDIETHLINFNTPYLKTHNQTIKAAKIPNITKQPTYKTIPHTNTILFT